MARGRLGSGPAVWSWLVNFTETRCTPGATPTKGTLRDRRSCAAMMPATAVPCPMQSRIIVCVTSTEVTWPASWMWFASTPLSTTATVTPPPRVRFQTRVKSSRCWAHGWVWSAAIGWGGVQLITGLGVGVGVGVGLAAEWLGDAVLLGVGFG